MSKQTIYTATFEQSKQLVNERYIREVLRDSTQEVVQKRTFGVLVACIFLSGLAFCIRLVEEGSPYITGPFISKITIVWYFASLICLFYYLFKLFTFRKKKILRSYLFNQTMSFIFINISILFVLFLLLLATVVTNSFLFSIAYLLFFAVLIPSLIFSQNRTIMETIYANNSNENKVLDFVVKFEVFSQKYGWIVLIFLFVIKRFFHTSEIRKGESFDLLQQVLGGLSPLLALVPILFLIAMKKELVKGFYLEKYIEDYRREFGATEEEWYGSKW